MQENRNIRLITRIVLMSCVMFGLPHILVASQYPLLNPGIGPSSLKTGTQPFSTMTISGANANPIIMSATSIDNIAVSFTYSPAAEDYNVVTYSIDFTKLTPATPIPAAALAAGVSVQISLVEAANALSFPNINSFQKSYFWNSGPTAANTLIVLVLGADGTVYAAGACAAFFIPNFAPIAYQVTINNGQPTQMSTVQIPMTTTNLQGVKIQSGVVSTPNMVTYPLFKGSIWGVAAPTNPAKFSSVAAHSNASSKIVMGIADLQNVNVSFNYTQSSSGAVTYAVDLTQFQNVTPQVLQNGLYLQIDLVPASQAATYAAAQLYPRSYFWSGPSASNTMYLSLVDAAGNIYAAGGCAGAFASEYTPTSYVVTINSGTTTQMKTQPITVNGTSTPVVVFQSGVPSTQNMVSYPLFNSNILSVPAPANPVSFSALSILGNQQNSVTLGVKEVDNITVIFDYDTALNAVNFSIDLTQYNTISASVLQAGLFLKIDLVSSSDSASYPSVNLIPPSYYWSGPGSANTMFVSLVDSSGNIYAAGGCTGDYASQYTPTAYSVIINSSSIDQLSTLPLPISAGNGQGVMIKSGVPSTPANLISYPAFVSTIWGAPTPTNPTKFAAITGQTTGTGVATLDATDIETISVAFNYGSNNSQAVTFDVDVTNIAAITPQILQAGLYVKVDLVPAAQAATYPAVTMIPHTYYYGGPSNSNTMFVSLVDGQGTIYAIGGCTGAIASQFVPANYVVTAQGKNNVSIAAAPVSFAASTVPAVMVQLKAAVSSTSTETLSTLGSLSYSALKEALGTTSLPLTEVTGMGTLTNADTLSFGFGNAVGFAMPKTTWAKTAVPNLYTQLSGVSGFNLSTGITYVMLAFNQNNNLITNLTQYPNFTGINFYLFAYDARGVSLFPAGIAVPIATMGNIFNSAKVMANNSVNVVLNTGSKMVLNQTVNYPAALIVTSPTLAQDKTSLSKLGSLGYSALKEALSALPLTLTEVTGMGTLTDADTLSFGFGNAVGFAMPKTTWANTAVPNLYTQLSGVSGFNLSTGVTYVMLAFDANNNLITNLTQDPKFEEINFYLFAYDAQGVSLFPTGIAVPIETMGNIFNSATVMANDSVNVVLNTGSKMVLNQTVNYPAALIVTSPTLAQGKASLSKLGSLGYSALKKALSDASLPLTEVTGVGTLTDADSLSFGFGNAIGFAMPKTTWAKTAVPNLYTQLSGVSGFNLSTGITYVMLAFDENNNLITNLTQYPNFTGINFYLFAYDAQGVSLFPAGIAVPIATMGNIFNSATVMANDSVNVILNTDSQIVLNKTVNYPAALIVNSSPSSKNIINNDPVTNSTMVTNLIELMAQIIVEEKQ